LLSANPWPAGPRNSGQSWAESKDGTVREAASDRNPAGIIRYMTGQAANGGTGRQDRFKKMRILVHTDFTFQDQDPPSSHTRRLLEHISCRRKRSKRQRGVTPKLNPKSEVRNPNAFGAHGRSSVFGLRIYFGFRPSDFGFGQHRLGPELKLPSLPPPLACDPGVPSTTPPIRKSRREFAGGPPSGPA